MDRTSEVLEIIAASWKVFELPGYPAFCFYCDNYMLDLRCIGLKELSPRINVAIQGRRGACRATKNAVILSRGGRTREAEKCRPVIDCHRQLAAEEITFYKQGEVERDGHYEVI
jgi:hypothetical protein